MVVVVVVVVVAIEAGVRKSLRQTEGGRLKRLIAGFAFATATSLRDGCLLIGVNHRCLRTYMMGSWVDELLVTHAPTSYDIIKYNNIHLFAYECALNGITIHQNNRNIMRQVTIPSLIKIT